MAEHCVSLTHYSMAEETQKWCLMHDAAEAYISDIATPVKHLPEIHKVIRPLEQNILRVISDKFGLCWPIPEEVHRLDKEQGRWELDAVLKGRDIIYRFLCLRPEEAKEAFLKTYERLFIEKT